jgi:hypothetical protein
MLHGVLTSNHHLEHSQHTPPQRVVVVVLRIDLLKRLKGLDRVVKMTHLIGVVADK